MGDRVNIVGLMTAILFITLFSFVHLASAESISECLGDSVIAYQVRETGNVVQYELDWLYDNYGSVSAYEPVLANGSVIFNIVFWTDDGLRKARVYGYQGGVYFFAFNTTPEPIRLEGGILVRTWHGACLLQLSTEE